MTPVEQDAELLSRMTCGQLVEYIRELSVQIEELQQKRAEVA